MFDIIIKFCLEHWDFILSSVFLLVSLLLAIFRKKPILNKVAIYLNEVFQRIPAFIDIVEKDGHGAEKKKLVLELCKQFLISEFGYYDFDIIERVISQHIEDVLSTPQKKEVTVCDLEKENRQ